MSLAGYFRLLPAVPGQPVFAWELSASDTLFRLVLNVAAIATMGALGLNLSAASTSARASGWPATSNTPATWPRCTRTPSAACRRGW